MKYPKIRLVAASFVGACITYIFSFASERFAQNVFLQEEAWGILFWGNHYIYRLVIAILSAGIGACIAGIIARRKGALIGVITTVPTFLTLGIFFYFLVYPNKNELETSNIVMLIVWGSVILPISYFMGEMGQEISKSLGSHFDSRKYSFLGAKWYHYFWLSISIIYSYCLLLICIGSLFKGINYLPEAWELGIGKFIGAIISIGLMFPIYFYSIKIIFLSFISGFLSLCNLSNNRMPQSPFLNALLYFFGIPIALNLTALIAVFLLGKNFILGLIIIGISLALLAWGKTLTLTNIQNTLKNYEEKS